MAKYDIVRLQRILNREPTEEEKQQRAERQAQAASDWKLVWAECEKEDREIDEAIEAKALEAEAFMALIEEIK